MPKLAVILLAVVVAAGLGWYAFSQRAPQPSGNDSAAGEAMGTLETPQEQSVQPEGRKDPVTGSVRSSEEVSIGTMVGGFSEGDGLEVPSGAVREFSMDSYYDMESKKAVFTLGEMVVEKGDKVRVNVRNTFGKHDFTIDEFNVSVETPQDKTAAIEFTADKAGEFIYYCAKPNHRAMGQWGILRVTE